MGDISRVAFVEADFTKKLHIPLNIETVHAGFTNPAEFHVVEFVDFNKLLIEKHQESTFLVYVDGDCMEQHGIYKNDMLVVDKLKKAANGSLVVCGINGEFFLRYIEFKKDHALLHCANPKYPVMRGDQDNDFRIWGSVTSVIRFPKPIQF